MYNSDRREEAYGQDAFHPLQRVQLMARHWYIYGPAPFPGGERVLIDEVAGEGVIGEYPILEAGVHKCLHLLAVFPGGVLLFEEVS